MKPEIHNQYYHCRVEVDPEVHYAEPQQTHLTKAPITETMDPEATSVVHMYKEQ